MRRLAAVLVGLFASLALSTTVTARPAAHSAARGCCRAAVGTLVQVELAEPVSTKVQRTGDTFALRLAQPLIMGGRILLPAGTPGVGEVVEASKPGMGGKPAKLVLAARYLSQRRVYVPLQGLQLAGAGHNNSASAQAVGLTGIAFMPLGFIGLAVRGGDVTFPAGTSASAKVASDVFLPSRGRASRAMIRAAAEAQESADQPIMAGAIEIPPPPPGMGQVVFFRRKSVLGTGQWFNVRENGQALGKLSNGAYFVQVTDPGVHVYTAVEEPELKDKLKLEVDPNETYFVEGALTKGVVISAAALTPSNQGAFEQGAKDLKLAEAPAPSSPAPAASSAAAQEAPADAAAPSNTAAPPPATAPANATAP